MRSEENPLDLNNLPEDYSKDGKQVTDDSSSYAAGRGGGYRKKKSGGNKADGKDESGKVYECRFCSLTFCKSQALGGHMNRHRQERETETLNRARQIVFNNDPLLGQVPPSHHHHHLGQPIQHGGFHQTPSLSDPTMPAFRSLYPTTTRLFSAGSTSPHQPPYMYSSPSRLVPFPSQYPTVNDYLIGHVVQGGNVPHSSCSPNPLEITGNNYTCIGAPVIGHRFNGGVSRGSSNSADNLIPGSGGGGGVSGGHSREMTVLYHSHDEAAGLNWGRSSSCTGGTPTGKSLDPSSVNRFQDGF